MGPQQFGGTAMRAEVVVNRRAQRSGPQNTCTGDLVAVEGQGGGIVRRGAGTPTPLPFRSVLPRVIQLESVSASRRVKSTRTPEANGGLGKHYGTPGGGRRRLASPAYRRAAGPAEKNKRTRLQRTPAPSGPPG